MPSICMLCKREAIPGDKSRSFHLFPENNELKEKWLKAIGRETVGKHARLCSDHFEPSCFHPKNGYNNIKTKLIKGAVPNTIDTSERDVNNGLDNIEIEKISNLSEINDPLDLGLDLIIDCNEILNIKSQSESNLSQSIVSDHAYTIPVQNNISTECSKKAENCDSVIEDDSNSNDFLYIDEKLDSADENDPNTFNSSMFENADGSKNTKHCFQHGNQKSYISRADFSSDEAWNRFSKYASYKNKLIKSLRQKCRRNQQRLQKLKESTKADKESSKN